ncbi:MAG: S8 family serine peptidase [Acidobacteriota bacterium]
MYLDPRFVRTLLFRSRGFRRFTQDSPILPNVWQAYAEWPREPQDLLLTPHLRSSASAVGSVLQHNLRSAGLEYRSRVVWNDFHVAVSLRFDDLLRFVLPATSWWAHEVWDHRQDLQRILSEPRWADQLGKALKKFQKTGSVPAGMTSAPTLLWMANLVGAIRHVAGLKDTRRRHTPSFRSISRALAEPTEAWAEDEGQEPWRLREGGPAEEPAPVPEERAIWRVDLNRSVSTAVRASVRTVKGDAARHLFEVDTSRLHWVVIDSGIDAQHPAFFDSRALRKEGLDPDEVSEAPEGLPWARLTRVERTYDFTRIRKLLDLDLLERDGELPESLRRALDGSERLRSELEDLKLHLTKGRQIDWALLEPFLRIPHDDAYKPPTASHGTHVAGILGARGYRQGRSLRPGGMCPDIRLWDLRVVGGDGDSTGPADDSEFSVISALQFVSWLNAHKDYLAVHGANLSLSIEQQVESFACGSTPVCEESNRLMASGVVVVAAAGNYGYQSFLTEQGQVEGFMSLSITDPGNAERVLTVGATHRVSPHTYGVSYFSSRGPTGDGRLKPDLVAPGEKIQAPVPNGRWEVKDGTSMAAPHVSGSAALLMARHMELMGKSDKVKKILCSTATDLGRERYFQGHGLVDALRALQSV